MAPSRHADEGGQLPLMDGDRIEEEEEEDCFDSVYKLISQGINAGDVKKLQDAGIYTCNGLMKHTKKSLTGIKGLSEAKVEKIFEAAEKLLSQGFMTGSDLLIPSFEELKGTPEAEVEKICNAAKKLLASSSQADEGVEEDESFDSIDMLIYEGINSGNVKMLKDVGIYTCNGLMKKKKEDLTGIKGLSEANVEKIIEAADKLGSQGLKTGSNLLINSNTGSQAIDRDYVTNLSKQAMPPADAGTASRTSGSQSWGLLNRVVFFVDPDAVDPEGVDLDGVDPDSLLDVCIIPEPLVKTILPGGVLDKKIPEVSVVIMHGSILSGSSCCSITGLVKCTDPAGNILIEVSQGPGTERLFVCQPGSGTALRLPPVPDSLRIKNPTPYCTGIVSDQCGSSKDFVVVHLQRPSTASSGSTNLLQALCFASSEETWRLKDLKADRLSRFEAKTVISHSDGSLVFMDLDYGMLIFDPTKEDVVRVVPFPEGTRKYHSRCVATSEGRLWHVLVDGVPYDPKVTMWWFDKESEWKERVCIGMDEVWSLSDYKDANLPVEVPQLQFIHPFNSNKLFFTLNNSMFSIEVLPVELLPPKRMVLHNLSFEVFNNCCSSPADLYPWVFYPYQCPTPTGSPAWESLLKAAETGKGLAALAWSTLKSNRRALEQAPVAAEVAGWVADKVFFPVPVSPMFRAGADVLVKVGQAMETSDSIGKILRTPAPQLDYTVVGTEKEATDAIKKWNNLGRPASMTVALAPECCLSNDEKEKIRTIFIERDAEKLLSGSLMDDFEVL